eukprot:GCRY01000336.1.p1 GENE.GCRY01000336.1~~GCRY01000336.1.p1  ORF type:complete len:434 (-),score=41.69 GCRY01000336.1:232-1533(-)
MTMKIALCIVFCLLVEVFAVKHSGGIVENLPGLNYNETSKQFAGHIGVEIDEEAGEVMNLFYWFFEAREEPENKPVILWMNGGPGCSSDYAVVFEHGPFTLENDGFTLKKNPYSWTNVANVLYLDQPCGVGYSYGPEVRAIEAIVGPSVYAFLQGWLEVYPQYKKNPLYISGESYAGKYVPVVAYEIFMRNKENNGTSQSIILNLKGAAIGNGMVNSRIQYEYYVPYLYSNGLIDDARRSRLNKAANECITLIDEGKDVLAGITCVIFFTTAVPAHVNMYNIHQAPYDTKYMTKYFNREDVKAALHVPETKKWKECDVFHHISFKDEITHQDNLIAHLLDGGIRVLSYNGLYDYACNYLGQRAWIKKMNWSHQDDFNNSTPRDWIIGGSKVGAFTSVGGFTYIEVEAAGHMVPHDKPIPALEILSNLVSDAPF